MVNKY